MSGIGSSLAKMGLIPHEFAPFYDAGDYSNIEYWGIIGDVASLEQWINNDPVKFEFTTYHIELTSPPLTYKFPEKYLVKKANRQPRDQDGKSVETAVHRIDLTPLLQAIHAMEHQNDCPQ